MTSALITPELLKAKADLRFWNYVEKTATCWLWRGEFNRTGYGRFRFYMADARPYIMAHRVPYLLLHGEIPKGLQLDHLCRNRACVNPSHLQPVTQRENILRGTGPTAANAKLTHCKRGHLLSPDNLFKTKKPGRNCKACDRLRHREKRIFAQISTRSAA